MNDKRKYRQNGHQAQGLRFCPPPLAAELTNGKGGFNQWMGHCPCHRDRVPSLSIRWGDNGNTVVSCKAACSQDDVVAWFRKRGWWLNPILPNAEPKKARKPVTVESSVAMMALTLNERRMFDVIRAGGEPSFNDFEAAGVNRRAIPKAIKVLGGLGLIRMAHNARSAGPGAQRLPADRGLAGAGAFFPKGEEGGGRTRQGRSLPDPTGARTAQ
jgi:hypothetical protein